MRKFKSEEERKAAKKEYKKRYRERHRDEIKAYYNKNAERIKARTRAYYYSHKPIVENLEGEEWKPLIGWEELYECSNLGRIKSLWHNNIINGAADEDGYRKMTLTDKDGKQYTFRKCRLIALTWIPNYANKPEVDHINTIRDDDRVCNLRWVDSKENKSNPQTIENRKKVDYGFNRGKHKNKEGKYERV